MKQNKIFRLSAILLVLTLLSTCVISGTFAKYTTSATADDNARVAKWGVTVEATGDNAFATEYTTGSDTNVKSSTTDNVIAPGTTGNLCSLTIGGTPEVAVEILANAELTLDNWKIGSAEYCPLEFTVTVGGAPTTYKIDGAAIKTVSDLKAAVENAIETAIGATRVAPNTPLTRSVSVTWAWDFDGNDDVKDTALGKAAADGNAPTISILVSATVTQID